VDDFRGGWGLDRKTGVRGKGRTGKGGLFVGVGEALLVVEEAAEAIE